GRARGDRQADLGERDRPHAALGQLTMQDQPTPAEIIGAVAIFLKNVVAANALEMMKRELETAPAEDAAERERLAALMPGEEGTLLQLNAELARRIEAGQIDLATPGLKEHLWKTTLAKL